jgi:hypothetical protein
VIQSDMAKKNFDTKVAVLDTLIQEVQELADLYVRLLDVREDSSATVVHEHVSAVLQAFAKTYIAYRHTVLTVSATVTALGGLEVRADWDF